MKRDFLFELGLTKEQINAVMTEYGKSIEGLRSSLAQSEEAMRAVLLEGNDMEKSMAELTANHKEELEKLNALCDNKISELVNEYEDKLSKLSCSNSEKITELDTIMSEKDGLIAEKELALNEKEGLLLEREARLSELTQSEELLLCKVKELEGKVGGLLDSLTSQAMSRYSFSSPSARAYIFEKIRSEATNGCDISDYVSSLAESEPEAFSDAASELPIFSLPCPSSDMGSELEFNFTRRHA